MPVSPTRRSGVRRRQPLTIPRQWSLWCILTLTAAAPAGAQSQCVFIANQHLDPAEIYDEHHQCGTCPGQKEAPELCGAINRVMVPYWSAPADLVAVPHRGLWGRPLSKGASENTQAALDEAFAAGYRVIEIDVALSGGGRLGQPRTFLGHYFSMRAVNGPPDKAPKDYSGDQLEQFHMNRRDTSPATGEDSKLLLTNDAIKWAKQNHVLLMVDPKVPGDAAQDEYERIIAYVLNEARLLSALSNIAIKTTHDHYVATENMKKYLNFPYDYFDGKFLWSPIPNKDAAIGEEQALGDIMSWHYHSLDSRQVITYELGLYHPGHWASRAFSYDGRWYVNLIDFVHRLTRIGKRSALWSIDPMSDKGTLGRQYNWKFTGNTIDDQRGNPLANLQYDGSRHVLMNTDRPEIYEMLVSNPYAGGGPR